MEPRDAWPRVRISTMVMTMVTSTTSVAPKLRASSLRIEDWNNIDWMAALLGCICVSWFFYPTVNYGL